MSIKARITLILIVLLAVFAGVLRTLHRIELSRASELRGESKQAAVQALKLWIDLASQPSHRFAEDFGTWSELNDYVSQHRQRAWAEDNLGRNLVNYGAHALWVVSRQVGLIYSAQQNAGPELPLPCDLSEIGATTSQHFFSDSRDGILEVWSEPIRPAQSTAPPVGWLVVAKSWDPRYLGMLGRLAEMNLRIAPVMPASGDDTRSPHLVLPLQDRTGAALRQLEVRLPLSDFNAMLAADMQAVYLLLFFGLLVITAVWLGVRRWVLNPLDRITASLTGGDPAPLKLLHQAGGEFAQVAGVIETSFAQREALVQENEERLRAEEALRQSEELVRRSLELRARLARDLHDGVIQSIYAAGLGLESAITDLSESASDVRTRLQHCRQSLNNVIREVRGFINGLEPEQMQRHGLAQELSALARTMQALSPVRVVHKVDPVIACRLTVKQEVHALQITRECISNALRHGGASKVLITLRRKEDHAVLIIQDNGRGFDPAAVTRQGGGLHNLRARAREMNGTVTLNAKPGCGATIAVSFPLQWS